MTPLLLAAALALGPADTPIEPIDSTTVVILLATPEAEDLCLQVGEVNGLILTVVAMMDVADSTLHDMSVAYWKESFEDGFGETSRLTAEADEIFVTWLEDCMAPFG